MADTRQEFWQRHPGLVWSNPDADDSIHIRAALLRPRFSRLLDIALEFGLEPVRHEWAALLEENSIPTQRARASVERILGNIDKGFSHAAATSD